MFRFAFLDWLAHESPKLINERSNSNTPMPKAPMKTVASLTLALLIGISSLAAAEKKLNVLFISADDLNCNLSSYNSQVKTPHLDRLAAMGVQFDKAYCQQPLCGPSRASVMTGLRPDTLDMHSNRNELRVKNPGVVTLGELFRKNGYYSARAGKIYHYGNPSQIGTDGSDDPATWDDRYNPAGMDHLQEENIINYGRPTTDYGISMAWWDPVSRDEEHTDGMVASRIIERIENRGDKPFFLAAGFFNPHCPYVAPKRYFDLYPLDEITMPDLDEAKADLEDVPEMALTRDMKNWPYYFDGVSVEEARKCKQAYFATISFIDAQVGRLLDTLEKEGLMESTVIAFWSDHGYFLGEKGLWYKRKAFELSARVPMILAGPGIAQGGTSKRTVELLDLYPTLADLCGLEAPDKLEGRSLRPLLVNPDATWDNPAVTQIWNSARSWGYSIRTERWRYTEWLRGNAGKELYDHANDPDEIHNLALIPEYAATMAKLSKRLQPFDKQPALTAAAPSKRKR